MRLVRKFAFFTYWCPYLMIFLTLFILTAEQVKPLKMLWSWAELWHSMGLHLMHYVSMRPSGE